MIKEQESHVEDEIDTSMLKVRVTKCAIKP